MRRNLDSAIDATVAQGTLVLNTPFNLFPPTKGDRAGGTGSFMEQEGLRLIASETTTGAYDLEMKAPGGTGKKTIRLDAVWQEKGRLEFKITKENIETCKTLRALMSSKTLQVNPMRTKFTPGHSGWPFGHEAYPRLVNLVKSAVRGAGLEVTDERNGSTSYGSTPTKDYSFHSQGVRVQVNHGNEAPCATIAVASKQNADRWPALQAIMRAFKTNNSVGAALVTSNAEEVWAKAREGPLGAAIGPLLSHDTNMVTCSELMIKAGAPGGRNEHAGHTQQARTRHGHENVEGQAWRNRSQHARWRGAKSNGENGKRVEGHVRGGQ